MINVQEQQELIKFSREDGKRLYTVSEWIYRTIIVINKISACVGAIISIIVIIKGISNINYGGGYFLLLGLLTAFSTFIFCFGLYILAVLVTHITKILVHILFSNVAIMEGVSK